MKTFGLRFGTAYQIYDDCLDIAGSEENAGKTLGTDLRKGKLTLPILHLLQTASSAERHRYSEMILRSEEEDALGLAEAAQNQRRAGLRHLDHRAHAPRRPAPGHPRSRATSTARR